MLLSCLSINRSRRTATVVTSQPLAARQSRMTSWPEYFPVPVMSRDWNVNLPTRSGVSTGGLISITRYSSS